MVESEFKETNGSNGSNERAQLTSTANQTVNSGFFSTKEEQYVNERLLEIQKQRGGGVKTVSKLEMFGIQSRAKKVGEVTDEYYKKADNDNLDKRISIQTLGGQSPMNQSGLFRPTTPNIQNSYKHLQTANELESRLSIIHTNILPKPRLTIQ